MELMATPRASAISPISGAAVPEEREILSTRERAVPTHSRDATCGDASGLSGMQRRDSTRGEDTRRTRSFPESEEGKSGHR